MFIVHSRAVDDVEPLVQVVSTASPEIGDALTAAGTASASGKPEYICMGAGVEVDEDVVYPCIRVLPHILFETEASYSDSAFTKVKTIGDKCIGHF